MSADDEAIRRRISKNWWTEWKVASFLTAEKCRRRYSFPFQFQLQLSTNKAASDWSREKRRASKAVPLYRPCCLSFPCRQATNWDKWEAIVDCRRRRAPDNYDIRNGLEEGVGHRRLSVWSPDGVTYWLHDTRAVVPVRNLLQRQLADNTTRWQENSLTSSISIIIRRQSNCSLYSVLTRVSLDADETPFKVTGSPTVIRMVTMHNLSTRCFRVTGGGSDGEWGRVSRPGWFRSAL